MDSPTKLFVYGIFLGERNRAAYNMTNPTYATVPDFATFGDYIVEAEKVPNAGLALTGLLVDYDDTRWRTLDMLEGNYYRIIVTTTGGIQAYMYVSKRTEGYANHSTFSLTN